MPQTPHTERAELGLCVPESYNETGGDVEDGSPRGGLVMQELRRIEQDILARGKVDSDHIESLRVALYAGGAVGRPAADFLVELHKRVQHPNPAFEHLFYRAITDHVLVDGRIDAEETAWLREVLFADGTMRDEERKFLHELKGQARHASTEFEALFAEAMKSPQERRTSGSGQ